MTRIIATSVKVFGAMERIEQMSADIRGGLRDSRDHSDRPEGVEKP